MPTTDSLSEVDHEDVVSAFNLLGYGATFGAVAQALTQRGLTLADLYAVYPSREALGAAWLAEQVPDPGAAGNVQDMFAKLAYSLLEALERQRDFGRAWVLAVTATGSLQLPQWQQLHAAVQGYFTRWFTVNHASISLPSPLDMDDVVEALADALCVPLAALVAGWGADRSDAAGITMLSIDPLAFMLGALLTKRSEYNDTGLLTQMHLLLKLQHGQLFEPLLNIVLKPGRSRRLADPVRLVEILRELLPPHAP